MDKEYIYFTEAKVKAMALPLHIPRACPVDKASLAWSATYAHTSFLSRRIVNLELKDVEAKPRRYDSSRHRPNFSKNPLVMRYPNMPYSPTRRVMARLRTETTYMVRTKRRWYTGRLTRLLYI
jgi:hypothetical protein